MNSKIKPDAFAQKKVGTIGSKNYQTYYEIHTPRNGFDDSTPIILLAGGLDSPLKH